MKALVITQFNAEGFHNYPSAPTSVAFLSHEHRHTFVVRCCYAVDDLNREKEIFLCREAVQEYLQESFGAPCQFENRSCEMIAQEIMEFGADDNMVWCEVWEENTGGARVEK